MAIGAIIGAVGGLAKLGVDLVGQRKANKEQQAADLQAEEEQKVSDALTANEASIQQANTGNDISAKASMNPAYGSPVFNPQQSNTIQSVFDPNQKTSVV